ncbi:RtcB family protein [Mycobacterium sp. KBS0706]|uniref:RtcB family protein n=1 Tax=Mycobacterium sp. KBS0706 TaxID=2578109 RepID=UPI0027D31EC0|nr:RtcB family protein [Mycobacterium sp. KBS0706]
MWTRGVPVDDGSRQQLLNTATLPFIHKHVAAMPDVHYGKGATIGSVIPTRGAIIPAAVGVDIGCGMCAVRTTLTSHQLPDSLAGLRSALEAVIPVGMADHGQDVPRASENAWYSGFKQRYDALQQKYPAISTRHSPARQIGTLGGGNHFIEVCLDQDDRVWVMLHSGSRGVGNRIGTFFIAAARREMERQFIHLPDRDLAYLAEGSEMFVDYMDAVGWAQDYARANRDVMLKQALAAMAAAFTDFGVTDEAINCHHNYVEREHHFGENVWVTRKGAVRAREGDLGIIPGSMGARSFIVRGKGNPDSFCSCSHGAGRVMSRTEAKRRFTVADHAAATAGIECRKDEGVIDETPKAYKDIDAVMAAQSDLVEVVHTLRQIVCVKG